MISKQELLQHWVGHRKLTRKTIEKFSEKDLFEFSVGGMRTFSELAKELLAVTGALAQIVSSAPVDYGHDAAAATKEDILKKWDAQTEQLPGYLEQISDERMHEKFKLFGQYENTIQGHILYFIDNEIHHRAQGFVYLRALGIEPPFFWDRF